MRFFDRVVHAEPMLAARMIKRKKSGPAKDIPFRKSDADGRGSLAEFKDAVRTGKLKQSRFLPAHRLALIVDAQCHGPSLAIFYCHCGDHQYGGAVQLDRKNLSAGGQSGAVRTSTMSRFARRFNTFLPLRSERADCGSMRKLAWRDRYARHYWSGQQQIVNLANIYIQDVLRSKERSVSQSDLMPAHVGNFRANI